MTEIIGNPTWSPVRQLETNELARGGATGNMNEQAISFANRTEFLRKNSATKAELTAVGGGRYGFNTLAEFEANKENIKKDSVVTIGEAGPFQGENIWNGVELKKSPYDPFQQSKLYTDLFLKDVIIQPSGVDINSINQIGNHLLTFGFIFNNLPANLEFTESLHLRVSQATGGFFKQEIHKLNEPNRVYRRMCRSSDGVGIWREPFSRFNRAYDGIDPVTIMEAGEYVLTNGINLPTGFSGSALLEVERVGGFHIRTIRQTVDATKKWEKVGTGLWVDAMPFALTNDRFPGSYNFRGLFTDADLNTFVNEGNYLINGIFRHGPSWINDTIYLEVRWFGAFKIQRATSTATINRIGQRRGFFSGGNTTWLEWGEIGNALSTSTGSSLNGLVMAVDGDSVVEQGDWPERVAARYGMTVHKFGFGGCRASYYPSSPLGYDKQCLYNHAKCINSGDFSSLIAGAEYTRDNHNDDNTPQARAMADLDWNTVDIFCIAFGTNDWTGNPVGTEMEADPEGKTFKGAMCFSIEQIQAKYPHIQIVLIGMSFRLRGSGADESINSDNTPNTFGYYLKDYQKAILDIAEKYHLPALDMYRLSGVNEQTHKKYLRDGVHPIAVSGYQHWANRIGSFLNSVI